MLHVANPQQQDTTSRGVFVCKVTISLFLEPSVIISYFLNFLICRAILAPTNCLVPCGQGGHGQYYILCVSHPSTEERDAL